jgi:hypothetical protein
MRRTLIITLALLVSFAVATPAGAITNGVPDDEEHPYVGQLLFYVPDDPSPGFEDPGAWYSCSGTLVSATVVLTAGHCTFAVGEDGESTTAGGGDGMGGNDIWVTFSEFADWEGFPASADYGPDENQQRYEDRAAWATNNPEWIQGTAFSHPEFADAPFFIHDVGVVILEQAVSLATYGTIAPLAWLDQYASQRGPDQHLFEVVGYGLTRSGPFTSEGGDIRLKGLVKLNTLRGSAPKDTYALFSNNPGKQATGGTCFGDSGGPIFDSTDSTMVVAVTSFGFSFSCSGVGGGYRIDQPDDLAFLAGFGITP